jgi:hypothetical protein
MKLFIIWGDEKATANYSVSRKAGVMKRINLSAKRYYCSVEEDRGIIT